MNRPFSTLYAAPAPNHRWIADFTLCLDSGGLAVCGCRHRPVLAAGGGLVDECRDNGPARHRCAGDGDLATWQAHCTSASLLPGQPARIQTGIPTPLNLRMR